MKYDILTKHRVLPRQALAALAFLVLAAPLPAHAAYPERAVAVVAAYPPGGSSSIAARTFAEAAERYVDQPVLVQNKPGAGGIVGASFVYNSDPAGYNLLLARVATNAVVPAMQDVPYDPMNFTYLGLISKDPYTCVTPAKSPYDSIDELAKAIKDNPGSVTYSSSGVGTLTQIAAVKMMSVAGIENPRTAAVHIPYGGEGPALAAVVGGHADFFCGNLAPMLQQIQAGNVNALFITTEEPIPAIENVPTVYELGYPRLGSIIGWSAIVGPPNMSDEAVDLWLNVIQEVKHDEKWRDRVTQIGSIPAVRSPKETRKFVRNQYQDFKQIVEKFDLRID